jgi:hypothetical protein
MRGPFRPARETHRELTGMVPIRLTRSHDLGLGIGIAHGFATLGTIGFEGLRLCGEWQSPNEGVIKRWAGSFDLDVRKRDHLGPLPDFIGEKIPEVGG